MPLQTDVVDRQQILCRLRQKLDVLPTDTLQELEPILDRLVKQLTQTETPAELAITDTDPDDRTYRDPPKQYMDKI